MSRMRLKKYSYFLKCLRQFQGGSGSKPCRSTTREHQNNTKSCTIPLPMKTTAMPKSCKLAPETSADALGHDKTQSTQYTPICISATRTNTKPIPSLYTSTPPIRIRYTLNAPNPQICDTETKQIKPTPPKRIIYTPNASNSQICDTETEQINLDPL
jgi:hypothetical protein